MEVNRIFLIKPGTDQYIAVNYKLKAIYEMTRNIMENIKKYFSAFFYVKKIFLFSFKLDKNIGEIP